MPKTEKLPVPEVRLSRLDRGYLEIRGTGQALAVRPERLLEDRAVMRTVPEENPGGIRQRDEYTYFFSGYGHLWRIWAEKPDKAEMAAAPWW